MAAANPESAHNGFGVLSAYGFALSGVDDFCHIFMTNFQAPAFKENTNCH
jgi:hypothetical protein